MYVFIGNMLLLPCQHSLTVFYFMTATLGHFEIINRVKMKFIA